MTKMWPTIGCLILALPPIVLFALVADYYFRVFAPKVAAFECHARVLDCIDKGQYEEALKHADILVEMNEAYTTPESLFTRARVHVRLDDLDAAICDLSDLIVASEVYADPYILARGRCYEEKGMREAAAADYRMVYTQLLAEIAQYGEADPPVPPNYFRILNQFWLWREHMDKSFGFDLLQFQKHDSPVDTERARLNAVLSWLREYVDVHPEIIANIDDPDAKVPELAEEEKTRKRGHP